MNAQKSLSLRLSRRSIWRLASEHLLSRDHPVEPETTLALAVEHKLSAYDAQYVVLAQRPHTVLVTEDRKLAKAFPSIARPMRTFVAAGSSAR